MRPELVREYIVLGQQLQRELRRTLLVQVIVAALLTGVLYPLNHNAAYSAAYGAGTSVLPTWVFAFILFQYQGASKAKRTVHNMYVAEGVKIAVSALLFGAMIAWTDPNWVVVFVSYLLTQLSLCIAPLFSE